jgi:hypothetical protein
MSVGASRQYLGRLGKVDNGQVAIDGHPRDANSGGGEDGVSNRRLYNNGSRFTDAPWMLRTGYDVRLDHGHLVDAKDPCQRSVKTSQ